MTTTQEAVTEIARCSPEAGGLVAQVMEANAAMTQSMLPSWEEYDRAVRKAHDDGYAAGYEEALYQINVRLFSGMIARPEDSPVRPKSMRYPPPPEKP